MNLVLFGRIGTGIVALIIIIAMIRKVRNDAKEPNIGHLAPKGHSLKVGKK